MDSHYTYIYRDHKGIPVYVGMGKRDRAHRHLTRTDKHPFVRWINRMKKSGHPIDIEFIAKNISSDDAVKLECELIAQYGRKDLKTGTLYNQTTGGPGASGRISTKGNK